MDGDDREYISEFIDNVSWAELCEFIGMGVSAFGAHLDRVEDRLRLIEAFIEPVYGSYEGEEDPEP